MDRIGRTPMQFTAVLAAILLLLAACQSSASPTGSPGASASGEVVEIEWYVGLGTGENPEQIPTEEAVVAAFNESHDNIQIELTVVDNTDAQNTLNTRMPTDPPDIIGPIGIRALQSFGDQLLDLAPYIESSGVDLSAIDQALIDAYNVDGKQIGIPMAVYPQFIYYNKSLFDEAGLAYPPHEVGEQYEGQDWTWDTVRDLAMLLTVDANGNDATSAAFDPNSIAQWGLDAQFTEIDTRALSTIFGGSGSVVADDGTTAQWPDNWREGLQFYYDAVWTDHFAPTKAEAEAIGGGEDRNTFQSGLIAMDAVHQWYVCCIYPAEGDPAVTDWDIAVLPEGPDGTVTSKLHADTIGILDTTEHPEEAFEVLAYLSQQADLVQVWGAMPAIASQRDAFFAGLDERFAPLVIDWNVSSQMLGFPDNPSHEAFMPNFEEADSANKDFGALLWTTPGLDLQAEIDAHVETLQALFDEGS
ncbi:MAG: extracellular solute-binding protein [Chloroflexota bacterium]